MDNKNQPPKTADEASQQTPHKTKKGLSIISSVLFFAVVIVSAIIWQQLNALKQTSQQLSQTFETFSSQLTQQQSAVDQNQKALTSLVEDRVRKTDKWVLSEAEYLSRMANYYLNFLHNPYAAAQLLKIADQRIASLNDPALLTTRQVIAKDMSALQAVPKLDLSGLLMRINEINHQVASLPIIPKKVSSQAPIEKLPGKDNWAERISKSLKGLKDVIVIRHIEQTQMPLLSPKMRSYVVANIQNKLSQTEWAALHHNTELYTATLTQADKWIAQYFDANAALTQNVLAEIKSLMTVNVNPTLPDIANATTAIARAKSKITNSDLQMK